MSLVGCNRSIPSCLRSAAEKAPVAVRKSLDRELKLFLAKPAHCGASLSRVNGSRYASNGELMTARITVDPAVCTGKPCIRGLRFPVARLLGLLAAGETREKILADYPYLEPEDIDEALRYAASLAEDETVDLAR